MGRVWGAAQGEAGCGTHGQVTQEKSSRLPRRDTTPFIRDAQMHTVRQEVEGKVSVGKCRAVKEMWTGIRQDFPTADHCHHFS